MSNLEFVLELTDGPDNEYVRKAIQPYGLDPVRIPLGSAITLYRHLDTEGYELHYTEFVLPRELTPYGEYLKVARVKVLPRL